MTTSKVTAVPESALQVLTPDGEVRDGAPVPPLDDETLVEMYRGMVLSRHFDERTISLQRQGRIGTYTPMAGQEGALLGSVHALDDEDWLVPSFREHGAKIARGLPPRDILLYWMGHESANNTPEELRIFSESIPVGSQIPHATGMAWGMKLRGDQLAVLCYFGDGATSEGDFHEALNFAGVFDVPAVFFCNNNQWAISVSREQQTASETLAQKAEAYGFEGIQVDGMDPLAVYQATREAIEKAKSNNIDELRPTLIEAIQYRYGPHTTADDPSMYRTDEEVEYWRERDPIPRLETFLRDRGLLDDETVDAIDKAIREEVTDSIEEAEQVTASWEEMFEHVYAEQTSQIAAQHDDFAALLDEYGHNSFDDH